MSPRPRDLRRGAFRIRSTDPSGAPLAEDIARTIVEGMPGTWMPAWKHQLDTEQIDAVVAYVMTLSPVFEDYESEPPERLVPKDLAVPPVTTASIARGRELYVEMQCAKCHGEEGRGDGPSAPTLTDDTGRPIRATDLRRGAFKGGSTPADVYRTLVTGFAGTPMPAYADGLPDAGDRWALVFYVRSLAEKRGWLEELLGLGADR